MFPFHQNCTGPFSSSAMLPLCGQILLHASVFFMQEHPAPRPYSLVCPSASRCPFTCPLLEREGCQKHIITPTPTHTHRCIQAVSHEREDG